ncbi:hypothetical protein [Phyllobacterium brassicacearum]|nr:hypothetical protein [Phyllobacterium brassicacearum]
MATNLFFVLRQILDYLLDKARTNRHLHGCQYQEEFCSKAPAGKDKVQGR